VKRHKAITLFSSAGIGELGIIKKGIDIILSNELLEDRHALYRENYPRVKCFTGDIRKEKKNIIDYYFDNCKDQELLLIYATPPCQGMSTNGYGRLMHEIRQGNRPAVDQRNRLIIPTMDVIAKIRPKWVVLENVPGMRNTIITNERGEYVNIMDYIANRLRAEYIGRGEVLLCSHYGVPQVRRRLITIYTRDPNGIEYFNSNGCTFFPEHERQPEITLRNAIGGFPPLDARKGYESNKAFHPLHVVPIMKADKYWWVSHTKEGDTAYNNQCVNPKCRYSENQGQQDVLSHGRWQASKKTPIYCAKCGELLPRPSMVDKTTGKRRLIKGFHSAYRRMEWDKPSRAITGNYHFEASDNKVHPGQNRVLSMYEALVIQSISEYDYKFTINGEPISMGLFADMLGESVPPKIIDIICGKIVSLATSRKLIHSARIKSKAAEEDNEQRPRQLQLSMLADVSF